MQLDSVPYSESSDPPGSADCTSKSHAIVNMGKMILFFFTRKRNSFWIIFQEKSMEDILTV